MTQREKYDRAFRLKRASHASVLHAPLPKDQWLKPEEVRTPVHYVTLQPSHSTQDNRYLRPHVLDVAKEDAERQMWDTVTVTKK